MGVGWVEALFACFNTSYKPKYNKAWVLHHPCPFYIPDDSISMLHSCCESVKSDVLSVLFNIQNI